MPDVLTGDCRERMRELADASVHACVTDPPYHLTQASRGGSARTEGTGRFGRHRVGAKGFMGKTWDGGGVAFLSELWSEVRRVLVPGAYLLAFGGTRTYHRLTCAIEDAGFEIRDVLMYMYGTGFPKSHNVNKDVRFCQCGALNSEHAPNDSVRRVWPGVSDVPEDAAPSETPDLLAPLQWDVAGRGMEGARAQGTESADSGELPAISHARPEEPGLEGRRDDVSQARELSGREIHPGAAVGATNGAKGRLRDDASVGDGADVQPPANAHGGGASPRPQSAKQHARESRTVARQSESQGRRTWPDCGRCGKPIVPAGLGSALKPAYEPIILARKPLVGTIAENVELYGTGALNIDACRLGLEGIERHTTAAVAGFKHTHGPGLSGTVLDGKDLVRYDSRGRWPANVVLDEAAAAALDAQTGELTSGFMPAGTEREGIGYHGALGDRVRHDTYGDTGGASRFFYTAKASRSEREQGLEGAARKPGGSNAKGFTDDVARGLDRNRPVANHHPTVKPVDLMRWLVRLVTPPNGVVLDPFTGSGTTGVAAVLEDRRFIGIEREPEYVAIAERRIARAAEQGSLFRDIDVA